MACASNRVGNISVSLDNFIDEHYSRPMLAWMVFVPDTFETRERMRRMALLSTWISQMTRSLFSGWLHAHPIAIEVREA